MKLEWPNGWSVPSFIAEAKLRSSSRHCSSWQIDARARHKISSGAA